MEMASLPTFLLLFHKLDGQWWAFSPVHQYNTHVLGYSHHPSPMSAAQIGTVPATPILFPYKICIPLPLSLIRWGQPLPYQPKPLVTWIVTPLQDWIQPLWHGDIWPHAHSDTLCTALTAKTRIHLVSNAAVHPNGTGSCAWVIWAS